MAIERVREYLSRFGLADSILEPKESSATVELAAQALGTEPCRIAKTMSFWLEDAVVLVVLAGDVRVDNKKFKACFGKKAKMLEHERTEELTGHAAGGVCPFAVREGVKVYLDLSLKRFETVFPAAGNANSAIELTPERLAELAQNFSGWVDVGKLPEAQN